MCVISTHADTVTIELCFFTFFSFEIRKIYNYLFYLLFCLFVYLLIFVHGDARFKDRTCVPGEEGAGQGGGGGGGDSSYNFPLFLVYPVDMPVLV